LGERFFVPSEMDLKVYLFNDSWEVSTDLAKEDSAEDANKEEALKAPGLEGGLQ